MIHNSFLQFSRYELTDPKAQSIVKLITESVQVENLRFLFALPWIRHFLPEVTGWNTQKKVKTCRKNFQMTTTTSFLFELKYN